jgi:hypothetical protein
VSRPEAAAPVAGTIWLLLEGRLPLFEMLTVFVLRAAIGGTGVEEDARSASIA